MKTFLPPLSLQMALTSGARGALAPKSSWCKLATAGLVWQETNQQENWVLRMQKHAHIDWFPGTCLNQPILGKRFLCRLVILSSYKIVTVGPYQVLGWYAGPKYSTAQYKKLPSNGGLTWINQQDSTHHRTAPSITFRKSRNRKGLFAWNWS